MLSHLTNPPKWSEWQDSNLRFPGPKPGDLTKLAYTPKKLLSKPLRHSTGAVLNLVEVVRIELTHPKELIYSQPPLSNLAALPLLLTTYLVY